MALFLLSAAHAFNTRAFATERVIAAAGGMASLPCLDGDRVGRKAGYRKLALSWSFERTGMGKVPLLMMGSDGVVKRGLCETSGRTRVSGERTDAGDYSLTARDLRSTDAGVYSCEVRHGSVYLERAVELHVVQVTTDAVGLPLEGSKLNLLCEMAEPLTGARYSWHRGGNMVTPTGQRVWTGDSGRKLHFSTLKPEDQGDWECHVTFEMLSVNAHYQLKVLGFLSSPQDVPTLYARPDSSATLFLALMPEVPCQPQTCGWLRGQGQDAQPVGNGSDHARTERHPGSLSLTLTPALASDRGFFTGYVNVSGHWIERIVRLELIEVMASQVGPVLVGSSLSINVSMGYAAGVDSVEWQHENGSVGQAGRSFREEGGGLYIPQVTAAHAGNWTCTLYWHGEIVGEISYLLEITALDYQAAEAAPSSRRITLVVALSLLLVFIVGASLIIFRKFMSRRRNFPALDVTLTTVEASVKKV
ncbi:lymphocyte activation gene 3 protein-like isoform X1 [Scyliorhinus canicula]|uniref:lymphocyte activation gene 3 protein-like isoform X1 n=2 Tax=Scyliorhinus canicula TaxID=7830 RepID=UPI0018F3CA87|nr:lymphocyte activation gene 3 protein-like isoform X1 [Scyliorhinus canicula]